MLSPSVRCDSELLQQLLDGRLPDDCEADLSQHLETCEACQRELESLAADTPWWQETRRFLSDDADDTHHLSNHESALKLDFLSQSDNPAMLGRLGEFNILEVIGRGGMGIVLKGYDQQLNRWVAIKVLGPQYAGNAAARRRFTREAQAAAAVVHPHVIGIHAVDAACQPPYFVMPFVPGESLQQRLDRTGLIDIAESLRIGSQIAEGLAAAHAQGLVHRDIKPANILLERNVDRVLITDFGLARAMDDASLTQSGVIAGTPQYMSPEQARGENIDARTDLFSLGSVMYAMLTGHPPFRSETPWGTLRRVTDDMPRSLREINPAVPLWLETLVFRLLAKQPRDRWPTAREVADLLQGCLAHVQQPAIVPLPVELAPAARWTANTRNSLIAGGLLLALLALAIGLDLFDGDSKTGVSAGPEAVPPAAVDDHWQDGFTGEVDVIQKRLNELEPQPDF